METTQIISQFFNGNKELFEKVKLTKEEVTLFEKFEWEVYVRSGLKNINGGYASVIIYDIDEDTEGNQSLLCRVECGEQDTGDGSSCDTWRVLYNRKTQEFESN
jgi:hypothetical protein